MAKSVYGKTKVAIGFNMTPMIDCTFLLIIFFILVTRMITEEYVDMDLPNPTPNEVTNLKEKNHVIVNVVPYRRNAGRMYDGQSQGYQIGTLRIARGDTDKLSRLLRGARRAATEKKLPGDFVVEIRADRSTHYLEVLPVLEAVQAAEIEKMRITTIKGKGT